MNTLAPSFNWIVFILAVTRTIITAWMSLNFSQIRQLTTEFVALEHLKNQYIVSGHSSVFIFDRIFFILAGDKDLH